MIVHSVSQFSNPNGAVNGRLRVMLRAAAIRQRSMVRWLAVLIADYGVVALAMACAHSAFVFARIEWVHRDAGCDRSAAIVLAVKASATSCTSGRVRTAEVVSRRSEERRVGKEGR